MDHKKFAIYEFYPKYNPPKIPSIKYLKLKTNSQTGEGTSCILQKMHSPFKNLCKLLSYMITETNL